MLVALFLAAAVPSATVPPPADPQTAVVHTEEAERFAALFAKIGGAPAAEHLRREYLDRGTYGVHVFMADRTGDAANMAGRLVAARAKYADAIVRCLPIAKLAHGELRAISLAPYGLRPEHALPQSSIVFGADTIRRMLTLDRLDNVLAGGALTR